MFLHPNIGLGTLALHLVVILYPNRELSSIHFKLQVHGFKEIKTEISVSNLWVCDLLAWNSFSHSYLPSIHTLIHYIWYQNKGFTLAWYAYTLPKTAHSFPNSRTQICWFQACPTSKLAPSPHVLQPTHATFCPCSLLVKATKFKHGVNKHDFRGEVWSFNEAEWVLG